MDELMKVAPYMIPVIVLHYILVAVALFDLIKRTEAKKGTKIILGLAVFLIEIIGPILYFSLKSYIIREGEE